MTGGQRAVSARPRHDGLGNLACAPQRRLHAALVRAEHGRDILNFVPFLAQKARGMGFVIVKPNAMDGDDVDLHPGFGVSVSRHGNLLGYADEAGSRVAVLSRKLPAALPRDMAGRGWRLGVVDLRERISDPATYCAKKNRKRESFERIATERSA